jgi:hypothetical protein
VLLFWRGSPWNTPTRPPPPPPTEKTPVGKGPSSTPGPTAPKPPQPIEAPAVAKTIHHELTSDPPGAHIIDGDSGEELGTTPITLSLPRSPRPAKLTLRRSGYQDRALLIDRMQDGATEQKLVPAKKKATTPSPQHEELLAPQL